MQFKKIPFLYFIVIFASMQSGAKGAELREGIEAYNNKSWELAAEILEPYAIGGDFNAQYFLGELYLKGNGKEQDFEQAFRWFFEAAKAGHAQSQANAAGLLTLGLGVPRDMPSAYYWWILSAIWTETDLTRAGFAALGEVAPLLTQEERQRIETGGRLAWQKGAE